MTSNVMTDDLELHGKALTISRIYFQSQLSSTVAGDYLEQRGIDATMARRFELGYAPDVWRGLVDHFSSHRVRLAAKDAGLLSTAGTTNRMIDFFRGRLMFPIRNQQGELCGYGGRIIDASKEAPKYINTRETALFNKSEILYGLHQHLPSIRKSKEAILVEGYLDVIRLSSAGFDRAVAPMGTALTPQQIELLANEGINRLWVCLDGDSAGRDAAARNIEVLMDNYHPAIEVMVVNLPDGDDPDSLIRLKGPQAFSDCLEGATPLAEYIHLICCEGFPSKPCLEDKALYLVRIEPYIEKAGGFLQRDLLNRASAYSGLPIADINAGKNQRESNEAITRWHPLVTLAARWTVYDENSRRIAERMSKISVPSKGLDDLSSLGAILAEGGTPHSELYHFAAAHGPLSDIEFNELRKNWSGWVKHAQLEANLETLKKMPFDEEAKRGLRRLLG